jgi:hypothetical protein
MEMTQIMIRRLIHLVAGLTAVMLTTMATAPVVAGQSSADVAAIRDFKLTPDFFDKWKGYEEEAARNPCDLSPMVTFQASQKKSLTLDQTITAFDAQPGAHAALERNSLDARSAILGIATLMIAATQEIAEQHPDMVKNGELEVGSALAVSPANMAFYKQHKTEMRDHQMKLAREQLKLNGGHLPACFTEDQ